jgi:isopenicillin N synthase-like dioxygenase
MSSTAAIPFIDVSPLFGAAGTDRERTDAAILSAAAAPGFFVAGGFGANVPIDAPSRATLLRLFDLPEREQRALWRRKFEPANRNVYRGFFPAQRGFLTSKEGIDLGPDILYGDDVIDRDDPLREPTPLPGEAVLPGWRSAAAGYYRSMLEVSRALMHSLARGLELPEVYFDTAFDRGLSTLRLLRYPQRTDVEEAAARDPAFWVDAERRCYVRGAAHVDSVFVTLLAQDGVAGLQARHGDAWIDVPPMEGTLAVNFGKVLERWTCGRIRATPHRVIGTGAVRMSIPFFYEARADAEIRPLPHDPADAFEPFLYGDYLWATTTQFVEFKGMRGLRPPRRGQTVHPADEHGAR